MNLDLIVSEANMKQRGAVECEPINEELRALIDLAPEAVFLAHRNGQLIYVNEPACELSGYMRPALLKRPVDRMLAVTWPHEEDEAVNPAWQRGRLDPVETWLRRADGSWLAVEARALLLPGKKVQIWLHDISTRQAQKDQEVAGRTPLAPTLGGNQRLLQTILDLVPVGIWIADREGTITFTNPAAEHIWNGTNSVGPAHDVVHKTWRIDTGEQINDEDRALNRALRGETSRAGPAAC
jgi:PAS domain S-box-containing protein